MEKSNLPYLHHILDAILTIEEYKQGVSWDEFTRKRLIQDGLVRQLTIIGEAAGHVAASVQQAHPEIPWSEIVGMRHRLVHDYFRVDLVTVWETVQYDLPVLKPQIERLLAELDEDS